MPQDDPLWSHRRVMLTPHVASAASPDGVARAVAEGVRAMQARERPDGLVDRDRGY